MCKNTSYYSKVSYVAQSHEVAVLMSESSRMQHRILPSLFSLCTLHIIQGVLTPKICWGPHLDSKGDLLGQVAWEGYCATMLKMFTTNALIPVE